MLVCMVGQTPLRRRSPAHCPPSVGLCSKIVGSKPCASSQRAATRPPGPAPITATLPVISRTVAQVSITLNDVPIASEIEAVMAREDPGVPLQAGRYIASGRKP